MTKTLDDLSPIDLKRLWPSPFVRKFCEDIVRGSSGQPILDVACGGARNSILLAYLGGRVLGIDVDLSRVQTNQRRLINSAFEKTVQEINFLHRDLIRDPWPFKTNSIGAIINVHFFHEPLLSSFCESLVPGGYLLIETVDARGGNFRDLPRAGVLRRALQDSCSFLTYEERQAGPSRVDAVTVKLVAVKQ